MVERRFGVRYQERGMGKLIRALGFTRISARPQHPRSDPEAQAECNKKRPDLIAAAVGEKARGKRLELCSRTRAGSARKPR